jgi:hypothetical protein
MDKARTATVAIPVVFIRDALFGRQKFRDMFFILGLLLTGSSVPPNQSAALEDQRQAIGRLR